MKSEYKYKAKKEKDTSDPKNVIEEIKKREESLKKEKLQLLKRFQKNNKQLLEDYGVLPRAEKVIEDQQDSKMAFDLSDLKYSNPFYVVASQLPKLFDLTDNEEPVIPDTNGGGFLPGNDFSDLAGPSGVINFISRRPLTTAAMGLGAGGLALSAPRLYRAMRNKIYRPTMTQRLGRTLGLAGKRFKF